MKNPVILISLLILSFLCIRHQVNAQQPPCIPEAVLARLFNDPTDCVSGNLLPEALPVTIVKVNFHFIGNEFYGGQPGDNSVYNGNKLANDAVMKLNEYMANILPNPVQSANFIGDSRIRFELYSDPNESTDTHDGVWYWAQAQNVQDVYDGDVMKITIWPIGVGGGASGEAGCTNIVSPCVSVYGTKARIEAQGGGFNGL